ncbi:hypothetical protein ACFWVC_36080 [Streptomyces sp. NPDC058691]|uniref:hypothetical protein n=1 Tax=Streptomyces sp. NPDC058691 TaxID=3346601 RepID=UPI003647B977
MVETDVRIARMVQGWVSEVGSLASEFAAVFEAVQGFAPGEHAVLRASAEEGVASAGMLARAGVPGSLVALYSVLRSAELPDFGNGIWIDEAASLLEQAEAGNYPRLLAGAVDDRVTVFATDGGGGMYAVSHAIGCVYHLTLGSLVGTTYDLDEDGYTVAAPNLGAFLEELHYRLAQSVQAQWDIVRA